jgi:WD40 repeat protein
VTASADGTARVWDDRGQTIATLQHGEMVYWAAFDRDGRRVATGGERTAKIWDSVSGSLLHTLSHTTQLSAVVSVSFDPSGRRLITADADRTARIWNADTGEVLHSLDGHVLSLLFATFDPSGALAVTVDQVDARLRMWDSRDGTLIGVFPHDPNAGRIFGVTFSTDGQRLVGTDYERGLLRIWDISPETRPAWQVTRESMAKCFMQFMFHGDNLLPYDTRSCLTQ